MRNFICLAKTIKLSDLFNHLRDVVVVYIMSVQKMAVVTCQVVRCEVSSFRFFRKILLKVIVFKQAAP